MSYAPPSAADPRSPTTNEYILFWASFFTLIAAGMGFAIRAAILGNWASQFGFTQGELGVITGAGLTSFCVGIFLFSLLTDRLGYGFTMVAAFVLHLLSAVITLAATPVFQQYGKDAASQCLFWGTFIFGLANGTCEAVINPLTATLFPRNKTHWLNILHAGWPGGLILGALLGLLFTVFPVPWEIQLATFLLPTLLYGALMFGRRFPKSEASAAGVSFGTMLLEFASPILLLLLLLHALVGYVELGTDSWVTNVVNTILNSKQLALLIFIWTSGLMFALRFFAGPIVHHISPLGLLFGSAVLGCAGLLLLGSGLNTSLAFCAVAATVYAFGKTFLWPTMLGVVSERFPRGGALTLGAIGGVGMLSAGLLGGPGIGYKQDYFATTHLRAQPDGEPTFERYAARTETGALDKKGFLFFPEITGLDGSKVSVLLGDPVTDNGKVIPGSRMILADDIEVLKKTGRTLSDDKNLERLVTWWDTVGRPHEEADKPLVSDARLFGGKMALTVTAAIPAAMALGYLFLILYFRARGGYKQEHLETGALPDVDRGKFRPGYAGAPADPTAAIRERDEKFTGGVEGPAEY